MAYYDPQKFTVYILFKNVIFGYRLDRPILNVQIDALEDWTIRCIPKDDIFKQDIALELLRAVVSASTLLHLRSLVEYFLDAFSPSNGIGGNIGQLGEVLHRLVQLLQKPEE